MHSLIEHLKAVPRQKQVFTFDALHCQKETVRHIVNSGNHYLVAVKKNQPHLYTCLETDGKTSTPLSQYSYKEQSHGRQVTRNISVFETPQSLDPIWCHACRYIQVQRSGTRGIKYYNQTSYYLSSCQENAQIFAEKIHGHWRIENQLHWVKDVIFLEDRSPLHQFQTVINFSILQTMVLNLFRFLGFFSVTEARRWLGHRSWWLMVLLE